MNQIHLKKPRRDERMERSKKTPATDLSSEIRREYDRLKDVIDAIPLSQRGLKLLDGTSGKVSVVDLIAYQIGWGKCLIRWYMKGLKGEYPEMPGDGFSKWSYVEIAKHFYKKYRYDGAEEQMKILDELVLHILKIVNQEAKNGNLDQIGIWPWCTLRSGKSWPLSKWIRVNTATPYKRVFKLIKKILL